MKDYEILYKIKHKKDKTDSDKLLIGYSSIFSTISEYLLSESKSEITPKKKTLEKISLQIDKFANDYN